MAAESDHLIKIAVLETEVKNLRDNTAMMAVEYQRRLSELNHAHAQATSDRNKYVNADLFYSKLDEIQKWRTDIDKWRWISVGAGALGGGVAAMVARLLTGQ